MPLLDCAGLTRRPYFEARDLALEPGEIVVLAGPSGSGKSLFLRGIADLDPIDAGEVRLAGRERASFAPREWRARVLYVHPSGVRLPGTVGDNLEAIRRLGVRARAGAADDGEPVLVLDPEQPADRLSSGEAQALALRRALACEPAVLLLDEPTSALHEDAAREWERRLRAWIDAGRDGDGGRSALWIAHEKGLAERLGARLERFP